MKTEARERPYEYWASADRERIGALICERFKKFWQGTEARGLVEMWRRNLRAYYGQDPSGGYTNSAAITFGGEQGELIQIHTGDYRQLVKGMHTLATSQRPAIEVTAGSNDPEAVSQTLTARQVIEYDLDEGGGGLEEAFERCHERALVAGEGYIVDEWDGNEGEPVGIAQAEPSDADDALEPEDQPAERVVYEGGPRARYKSPWDVARDLHVDRSAEHRWYVVRDRAHRWELAAQYPEHARVILGAEGAGASEWRVWDRGDDAESDYVETLTLYHMPTSALPAGRKVVICDEAVLVDLPYPLEHMCVHPDLPGEEFDQAVGYSDAWDLLALQQAVNAIEGGMLTTYDVGSTPSWIAPRGQGVDSRMLAGGLKLIEYDDGGLPGASGPGLLERPEVRGSDLQLSEHYTGRMERNSGINGVVRGEPDDNITSGSYAALVASMAVQANSSQQRAYAKLMRSVINGRLELYKLLATEPRLIEIVGKDSTGHVREFTGEDIRQVRRVRIELANPLLRTVQGKTQTADRMLDKYGAEVITPDRYLSFLQTGRLDDLTNREATHKVNARRENESFREGTPVPAMVWDHHAIHIREHFAELDDPAVRLDQSPQSEAYKRAVLDHVQMHVEMWTTTAPEILTATGQAPPPAPPMGPEGPMGPPPGGPPPPPMGPPGDAVAPGANAIPGGAPSDMPELPTNPMNGQPGNGLGPNSVTG